MDNSREKAHALEILHRRRGHVTLETCSTVEGSSCSDAAGEMYISHCALREHGWPKDIAQLFVFVTCRSGRGHKATLAIVPPSGWRSTYSQTRKKTRCDVCALWWKRRRARLHVADKLRTAAEKTDLQTKKTLQLRALKSFVKYNFFCDIIYLLLVVLRAQGRKVS